MSEKAEREYRRHLQQQQVEREWFNDPKNWKERNRPLSPAELEYTQEAMRRDTA